YFLNDCCFMYFYFFFFQAEDGIRDLIVTGVQTCALPISLQRQGRIGFHVGSLSEEAAIIGSAFAMRKTDWLFPCYREFGAALMRSEERRVGKECRSRCWPDD